MFDSSQTLLPAEELKKRFEQEGKLFHHHLKNRVSQSYILRSSLKISKAFWCRHLTRQAYNGLVWHWRDSLYPRNGN